MLCRTYRTQFAHIVILLATITSAPSWSAELDTAAFSRVLATYTSGDNRAPLFEISKAVADSVNVPANRAALAKMLTDSLRANTTPDAKQFCAEQLARCATAAEVPAIAQCLADERISYAARFVLQNIGDPAAGAALRDAAKTLKGRLLIGVIDSLGARREPENVAVLKALLDGNDAPTALAVAAALGQNGTPDAIAALIPRSTSNSPAVQVAACDALLRCAESALRAGRKPDAAALYQPFCDTKFPPNVRVAALVGLAEAQPDAALSKALEALQSTDAAVVTGAVGVLRWTTAADATKQLAGTLRALSPALQTRVLDVLAQRGDASARDAILAALKHADESVRVAAIEALASVGTTEDISVLLQFLSGSDAEKSAARQSLSRMRDAGVDALLLERVVKSGDTSVRAVLLGVLAARQSASAPPVLAKIAREDADAQIRTAAIDALGLTAGDRDAQLLLDVLCAAKTSDERNAVVTAIGKAAPRMKDRDALVTLIAGALKTADLPARSALLSALPRVNSPAALETLRGNLEDANLEIRDAAVRALAQWTDVAAVNDLLDVVKGENATHRVLALRCLASLVQKLPQASASEAVEICRKMLDASAQTADKRTALGALGAIKSPLALKVAQSYLENDALKQEAASATVRIAQALGPTKEPGKSALQKVLNSNVSDSVKQQAQAALTHKAKADTEDH